jgi:hypothetical protein
MIGGAHDGHIAIVPSAIEVGLDVGSDGHLILRPLFAGGG